MLWTTITGDDLDGIMTDEEKALATVSAGGTISDRAVPVVANLIAEIRGMIATWSPNTLSADATKIPPSFKARALIIARWRLLTAIPDYEPNAARKTEYEAAESFFKDVARGQNRPQPADDAMPNEVPGEKPSGVEIVSAPGSRTGRSRMDGV